jgi:hypothetical protein
MFDIGDLVKTASPAPRQGLVDAITPAGVRVCFDLAKTDCSVFPADQLTLIQDEPEKELEA